MSKHAQRGTEYTSTSGSTHGAGLNQQTRSLRYEIRVQRQSPPFSLNPPPPMTHSFSRDPSPSPLPTVNHTHGVGGGELEVKPGELWPFGQSTWTELVCVVRARVYGSHLRFTHNPLPPLCFFAISNGGCHGQSPEPATDLVQVALWLLSSPRSRPDP